MYKHTNMDSRKCLYGKASLNISTEYMNASMNSITGSHSAHHLCCSNVCWWGFSKRIVELSYDSLCNVSTEKKVKKKWKKKSFPHSRHHLFNASLELLKNQWWNFLPLKKMMKKNKKKKKNEMMLSKFKSSKWT